MKKNNLNWAIAVLFSLLFVASATQPIMATEDGNCIFAELENIMVAYENRTYDIEVAMSSFDGYFMVLFRETKTDKTTTCDFEYLAKFTEYLICQGRTYEIAGYYYWGKYEGSAVRIEHILVIFKEIDF